MSTFTWLYLGAVLALGGYLFWVGRLRAALVMLPLVFIAYHGYAELLSRPKPVAIEVIRNDETAQIIAYQFHEGQAIYVWLRLHGQQEPRYYQLPWRLETAREIAKAFAEANGRDVVIDLPFDWSWDDRPPGTVHPVPPFKGSEKGGELPPPRPEQHES